MTVPAPDASSLVAAYGAELSRTQPSPRWGGGPSRERHGRVAVKRFWCLVGPPEAWSALSVDEQLALEDDHYLRPVVAWLLATGRTTASAAYLVQTRLSVGAAFARFHAEFFAEVTSCALALGARNDWERRQWAALALAAAIHGVDPDRLTTERLVAARDELRAACRRSASRTRASVSPPACFRPGSRCSTSGCCPSCPENGTATAGPAAERGGPRWRRAIHTSSALLPAGSATSLTQ